MIIDKQKCDHDEGVGHNCQYVEDRNRLIPTAIKETDTKYPKPDMTGLKFGDYMNWTDKWDKYYLFTMDRLYKEFTLRIELLVKSQEKKA